MKTVISKTFEFSSAHLLKWHIGKCKNLHGHNYLLTVFLKDGLDENGIIMDYYEVSEIVNGLIISAYDHKNLNDYFENPTAELLAKEFLERLHEHDPRFYKVILQETPKTTAEAEL